MTKVRDNGRKDAILATAASQFRRRGFERTSVRDIAEALGMTSGSLFYHFATKEELLVAVMEGGVRDIMQSVRDGLAGETRLPERLLSMVRSHLKALLGPRLDAMTVLLYEWRSLSPAAQTRVLASRDAYEALWMEPIHEAALLGLVESDAVLVRQTVLGALNWTAQWYRPEGRLDVDTLAQRMFTMLLPKVADCLASGVGNAQLINERPGPDGGRGNRRRRGDDDEINNDAGAAVAQPFSGASPALSFAGGGGVAAA